MVMSSFLPVGWTNFPLPIGMGFEKVPTIRPVTVVQCPFAILIGCSVILRSGSATNSAFKSSRMFVNTAGIVAVGPAYGDVLRVRFLKAIPVLIAEDIEIQGVERH